ncbi:MAG: hypothetical protein ACTSPY_12175 [Candidatus Helarchaeota archaeon]
MSIAIMHLGYFMFSIVSIICAIKIGFTYRKNKNIASILLIVWFIIGFFIGIFGIFDVVYPNVYKIMLETSLVYYITILITILLYILDFKLGLLIPMTIMGVNTVQYFLNLDYYILVIILYLQIMSFIPVIGFYYISFVKRDGKSFSFATSLVLLVISGMMFKYNTYITGSLTIISSIILLLGIFGMFDNIFELKKHKKTWIEQQF